MESKIWNLATQFFEDLKSVLRRLLFFILSVGPMPKHIAFIMDGNRRYAKQQNLEEGAGHKEGYCALMNMLRYCFEFDVKHVTVYAFSIENFKRRPEEVQSTMQLIQEKIESLIEGESVLSEYGVRVYIIGNFELLSSSVKLAAKRAMDATADNSKYVLSICIAYTSTDEIVHAIEETCKEKSEDFRVLESSGGAGYGSNGLRNKGKNTDKSLIDVEDIEKHMRMAVAPDPDIIIRTSGETRLSNFLLWQSASCLLYSPHVLWPEIGLRHLVRAILDFQRSFSYLKRKRALN
ncbi:dehydrodolichyl diphosphate synthase 6-like [Dorcoceras hygrometricum]|uniref:Alkyl transferase n=1 Tax=Dorcoceras hygrometricum TaxID=472368 RepID=A0A2Z7A7R2_9LAMI|nr:dehydrodolichyl diphosphate synthase 6-like [Dorcoceras hygrometricum]KZV14902.1 dehydrodolichyl diphosphate synthase 6-like [Dorcoceras hygrometricum]